MSKPILPSVFAITWLLLQPATVAAQSAIAGVVRDSTGAALPGVTVEVTSRALIEKLKNVTTDGAGQYRVVDLRPGTYRITCSIAGFTTVEREIVLESHFTAPVNFEMTVGPVATTVDVTSTTPLIDVQTAQRREVLTKLLLDALPTGRNYQLMAATVPSVTTGAFDVGGSTTIGTNGSLMAHGSLAFDSRTLIDGMVADCMYGFGQAPCQYDNEAQTEELAVLVSGGAAEIQLSGVMVNRIPRAGGNAFHGEGVFFFAHAALQSSNIDDALRERGLAAGTKLYQDYDANYSLGGPIIRDRLWFFASGRNRAYDSYVAGAFNPDGTQAVDDNAVKSFPGRLTAQFTPKNRLTAMFDWGNKVRGHRKLSSNVTPAASVQQSQPAEHIAQAKWTSTPTSHLVFETGYTQQFNGDHFRYEPDVVLATCRASYVMCPPGTSYGSIAHEDTILNTQSVAPRPMLALGSGPSTVPALSNYAVASLTYVSGAHLVKLGIQQRWGYLKSIQTDINGDIVQQYRNGVPFAVLALNTPVSTEIDVNADRGVYVQDTWTMRRLTLAPGLRWDHFNSSIPAVALPAGRFVPVRYFDRVTDLPNWNNTSPRIGVSYDATGHGKTAVKGTFGLYVQSGGPVYTVPYSPAVFSMDQRAWDDRNRDDIAQEDEIGPPRDVTFGVRRNQNPDAGIKRPHQRVWDIGVQHEVMKGLAVSASYNHRSFHDIIWTQNLAIPLSEYTLLAIPDPRANGQTLPLYNVNRSVLGLVNELDTNSSGDTQVYRGVDVSFNWRLPHGGVLSGGTSTGRTVTNTCEVEDPNSLRFCDYNQHKVPLQTLLKLSGTYLLPGGVRLSGTFQRAPGTERVITYQVTKAQIPTLVAPSVNIRLNEPGTVFNETVNQLDLTIAKSVRRGSLEVRPEISLFNALNANPVLTQNNWYGVALGNALTVLPPRLARLGLTVAF